MDTVKKYYRLDKRMGYSHGSQSFQTLRRLTDSHGEDVLMWYQGDSLVRTYQQRARERESAEAVVVFGDNSPVSSVKFNPDTFWWKTHHCLLVEDLTKFSLTLPRWGMMLDGVLSEQTTQVPHTKENESGLWLTPKASDTGKGECQKTFLKRMGDRSDKCAQSLPAQVNNKKTWPTPTCQDAKHSHLNLENRIKSGRQLQLAHVVGPTNQHGGTQTRQTWPTPCTRDYKGANSADGLIRKDGKSRMDQLPNAVAHGGTQTRQIYPTPCLPGNGGTNGKKAAKEIYGVSTGQLNPEWVELLMGFPMGWTCLDPISEIEYKKWLMEMSNGENKRESEAVRNLRGADGEEKVQRNIGVYGCMEQAEVLRSFVREHKDRYIEVGLAVAGKKVSQEELRMLWHRSETTGSPHRRELQEHGSGKSANTMHLVSQVYPSYGSETWQNGTWESTVNRVETGIKNRVDRLKAIGNAQVPRVVELAWETLCPQIGGNNND